ncbi:MAG TPA: branched-chain amino acid ABC transporter permease [Synergistales bacterium]|nr:branched-chain amino acid ABC transporter permease [Synergistales bacterium]
MGSKNSLSKGNKWLLTAAAATLSVIAVDRLGLASSYVMFILMVGLCNVVLTVSLNLITGVTGQFSLGHAGFMAVGAYLSAYLSKMVFGLSSSGSGPASSLLFFACLLCGAALAAGVAFLLGGIILRLTGDYLCIATLGFNQIVVVALNNLEIVGGSRGFYGIPKLSTLTGLLILTWFAVIVISRYVNSVKGRNCEAILGDETAAESLGVDSFKVKLHSFVTGCFFAALAGGMLIHLLQLAHPTQYTFIKSIEILLMVVVGGMGNVAGSVISGMVLTILPEALRFSQDLRLVLYPLILIIFISRDPSRYFYKFFPARTAGGGK